MTSKYLIIEDTGLELPIVFNPILKHDAVGKGLVIKSAGFCKLNEFNQWRCWGASVSLKINSRHQDANILNHDLQMEL